jgi:hypothetical protein
MAACVVAFLDVPAPIRRSSMSAEDLTRRLKELHELRALRKSQKARHPYTSETLQSLAILDQVQERLLGCLQSLHETLPALKPVRRMDSGAWRLGLRLPLDPEARRGQTSRPYSRCEFSLEIDTERRQVRASCHATAFDRDLPTQRIAVALDELPWNELQDFFESACLQFAERWFALAATQVPAVLVSAPTN